MRTCRLSSGFGVVCLIRLSSPRIRTISLPVLAVLLFLLLPGYANPAWASPGAADVASAPELSDASPSGESLLTGIKGVAAGGFHTCAVTQQNAVQCWGSNTSGQLGDGTTTWRLEPRLVVGLTDGAVSVQGGVSHTCALLPAGEVWCWGENSDGQLGNGTLVDSATPVAVSGLPPGVKAIAIGNMHSCALLADGGVRCWGYNFNGQLGDGTTTTRTTPTNVQGLLEPVVSLAAGPIHTCAIDTLKKLYCWGGNDVGQLGDGSTTNRRSAVHANLVTADVIAVTIGFRFTCVLTAAGGVKCWGVNDSGQLGNGTLVNSSTPGDVVSLTSGVSSLEAGYQHVCVTTVAGAARCWGANDSGQTGDGTATSSRATPVAVNTLLTGAAQVTSGYRHSCALTSTGGVKCWGLNEGGQLGNGKDLAQLAPVQATALTGVKAIAAGWDHTCAVDANNNGHCWGRNQYGQLGDGTLESRFSNVAISGLGVAVAQISAGTYSTCARLNSGALQCWGGNFAGQLGDGTVLPRMAPTTVSGFTKDTVALAAGDSHVCAIRTDSLTYCWGNNVDGQLGNNTNTNASAPVVLSFSGTPVEVGAGYAHSCRRYATGEVDCWGNNSAGQLGTGGSPFELEPAAAQIDDAVSIRLGGHHTCAVTDSGGVRCWGLNTHGQVGDGTNTNRNAPVGVTGLGAGVVAVATGANHSCALLTSGAIYCWGSNVIGQLGDGTTTSSNLPVPVAAPAVSDAGAVKFTEIVAGAYHTCALTDTGRVYCWGNMTSGQVGIDPGWNAVDVVSGESPPSFALNVTRSGTGSGTVVSVPAGIDCGADCSETYRSGTVVSLTATPASGSAFAGWSGACTGGGACMVTIDRQQTVSVTFNLSSGQNPYRTFLPNGRK